MDTQVYYKTINELVTTIHILIARDIAIPIDLHARAVEAGIDVQAILNKRK